MTDVVFSMSAGKLGTSFQSFSSVLNPEPDYEVLKEMGVDLADDVSFNFHDEFNDEFNEALQIPQCAGCVFFMTQDLNPGGHVFLQKAKQFAKHDTVAISVLHVIECSSKSEKALVR